MLVVYTGTFCPKCNTLKRVLKEKGIEYTERDIDEYVDDVYNLGIKSIPAVWRDGDEKAVVGLENILNTLK